MSTLRTTVDLNSGDTAYEVELHVEYSIHPGCRATSLTPAEETTATIDDIHVISRDGETYHTDWLANLLADDPDLLALCIEHDADEHAAQAEYRAEAIREERMLGDR